MMKKTHYLIFSFILIISINPITYSINTIQNDQSEKSNYINTIHGGWLEERSGIKILYLNGSYYDMGYQQGILLKEEIKANFNTFCNFIVEKNFTYEQIIQKWQIMEPLLPQCYKDEMNGIADATGLSFENISALNVGFYLVVNCGSFAVWGNSTINGKLFHARSHDFPITLKDPETGTYFVETQVIIIRQPDNQYSSLSPSEAGFVSVSDGFNEKQISAGMLSSWTDDETVKGIGVGFRIRMVLDFASTIDEAIGILTSHKTLGYNFIVTDGKIPIAYAVETTATLSYVGTWNDLSESTKPFWKIKNVVRRSNMFVNQTMAHTQRGIYNPSLFPMLQSFLRINKMSGTTASAATTWIHYVAISKGVQSEIDNLDLNNTMKLLRYIYLGKTDIRFLILQLFKLYSTSYQWVMCPETGDFVLSFGNRDYNAYQNPIKYFNFNELLNTSDFLYR